MLLDMGLQAAANSGACVTPGLVLAFDSAPLTSFDIACYILFWFALVFESRIYCELRYKCHFLVFLQLFWAHNTEGGV